MDALDDPLLDDTAKTLTQFDDAEGEAVVYQPITSLTPSDENFRDFPRYVYNNIDKILGSKNNRSETISDVIKNPDCDITEEAINRFIDFEHCEKSTGLSDSQIKEYWASLCSLARNIYTIGLGSPVSAYIEEGNAENPVVIYGHRRLIAHYLIGYKTIRCVTNYDLTRKDKDQIKASRFSENFHREDLSDFEKMMELESILDSYSIDPDKHGSIQNLSSILSVPRYTLHPFIRIIKSRRSGLISDEDISLLKRGIITNRGLSACIKGSKSIDDVHSNIQALIESGNRSRLPEKKNEKKENETNNSGDHRSNKTAAEEDKAQEEEAKSDQADRKEPSKEESNISGETKNNITEDQSDEKTEKEPGESVGSERLSESEGFGWRQEHAENFQKYESEESDSETKNKGKQQEESEHESLSISTDFESLDEARIFIVSLYNHLDFEPKTRILREEDIEIELKNMVELLCR